MQRGTAPLGTGDNPMICFLTKTILRLQSKSVITNSWGPTKFVCLLLGFVITGLFYVVMGLFGTELFVRYNRVFVITEFVITEFHYTLIDSGSYQFRSYLSFNIK